MKATRAVPCFISWHPSSRNMTSSPSAPVSTGCILGDYELLFDLRVLGHNNSRVSCGFIPQCLCCTWLRTISINGISSVNMYTMRSFRQATCMSAKVISNVSPWKCSESIKSNCAVIGAVVAIVLATVSASQLTIATCLSQMLTSQCCRAHLSYCIYLFLFQDIETDIEFT